MNLPNRYKDSKTCCLRIQLRTCEKTGTKEHLKEQLWLSCRRRAKLGLKSVHEKSCPVDGDPLVFLLTFYYFISRPSIYVITFYCMFSIKILFLLNVAEPEEIIFVVGPCLMLVNAFAWHYQTRCRVTVARLMITKNCHHSHHSCQPPKSTRSVMQKCKRYQEVGCNKSSQFISIHYGKEVEWSKIGR